MQIYTRSNGQIFVINKDTPSNFLEMLINASSFHLFKHLIFYFHTSKVTVYWDLEPKEPFLNTTFN